MAPEAENNLRLEIGHVLVVDLVGYSKLLIEEQKERLRQLTGIVLATAQVVRATNEQHVRQTRLPGLHRTGSWPFGCANGRLARCSRSP